MSTGIRATLGMTTPFAPLLAAVILAVGLMATHEEIAVAGVGSETELAGSLDAWSQHADRPKLERFAQQPVEDATK